MLVEAFARNQALLVAMVCQTGALGVTPQIRDVTGQRQTYTYASEALTY